MKWIVDQVRLVYAIEAKLPAKFIITVAPCYLATASTTEVPAIVGADTVTNAAIVDLVGDLLLIMRERGGFRWVEPRRPSVHEPFGRIIQVLDDFSSRTALVAKLSHCVRNNQIGR